jgi:hypothetical protein
VHDHPFSPARASSVHWRSAETPCATLLPVSVFFLAPPRRPFPPRFEEGTRRTAAGFRQPRALCSVHVERGRGPTSAGLTPKAGALRFAAGCARGPLHLPSFFLAAPAFPLFSARTHVGHRRSTATPRSRQVGSSEALRPLLAWRPPRLAAGVAVALVPVPLHTLHLRSRLSTFHWRRL